MVWACRQSLRLLCNGSFCSWRVHNAITCVFLCFIVSDITPVLVSHFISAGAVLSISAVFTSASIVHSSSSLSQRASTCSRQTTKWVRTDGMGSLRYARSPDFFILQREVNYFFLFVDKRRCPWGSKIVKNDLFPRSNTRPAALLWVLAYKFTLHFSNKMFKPMVLCDSLYHNCEFWNIS